MPLIKGSSQAAISQNIRTESKTKPHNQAVAIAMDIARRAKRANGGPVHIGPIHSPVAGRTDHLAMDVPSGSYVIPADIVSGLGEGNTTNGLHILEGLFPPVNPKSKSGRNVPIMAAGGEFVCSPETVAKVGGGDEKRGMQILDRFVLHSRKKLIKTLKGLPGPAR